jgi:biopolymer transport protein ExbD
MASASSRSGDPIVGINVTPLVDVVLVLLIVLMVAASYTVSRAIPLDLPRAASGESAPAEPLALSIDAQGALYLDGSPTTREGLRAAVREARSRGNASVVIAADGGTAHRAVVGVIDLLRGEGVAQFAINVAPSDLVP